jgi:hypothetical protein
MFPKLLQKLINFFPLVFFFIIKFNKFNSFNSFNSIQFRSCERRPRARQRRAGMLARSRTQVGEKTCSQKRTKLEKNQTILIQKRKANGRKACLTLAVTSQCRIALRASPRRVFGIVGLSQVGVARKFITSRSRTQRQFWSVPEVHYNYTRVL